MNTFTSFSAATAIRSLHDGTFITRLPADWTVQGKPHGGLLVALMAKAAAAARSEQTDLQPLAVSAQFLYPAEVGPVLLRTDVRKVGQQVSMVTVAL